jgi:hypothetical protein
MIYAAETTHSNRERKLVQPLEGSPERLRHHLRRPHQRRTTLLIVDRGGLATCGASARMPLVVARLLGQYGNRCPSRQRAQAKNFRSPGQSNSTRATARQTSSASVILRGRPGPPAPVDEELVSQDVESDQRAEAGGHDGHLHVVDGATEHRLLRQLP